MKAEFRVEFNLPNGWNKTELNEFLRQAEHEFRSHYTLGPDCKTKYHPEVVRVSEVDFRNEEEV